MRGAASPILQHMLRAQGIRKWRSGGWRPGALLQIAPAAPPLGPRLCRCQWFLVEGGGQPSFAGGPLAQWPANNAIARGMHMCELEALAALGDCCAVPRVRAGKIWPWELHGELWRWVNSPFVLQTTPGQGRRRPLRMSCLFQSIPAVGVRVLLNTNLDPSVAPAHPAAAHISIMIFCGSPPLLIARACHSFRVAAASF